MNKEKRRIARRYRPPVAASAARELPSAATPPVARKTNGLDLGLMVVYANAHWMMLGGVILLFWSLGIGHILAAWMFASFAYVECGAREKGIFARAWRHIRRKPFISDPDFLRENALAMVFFVVTVVPTAMVFQLLGYVVIPITAPVKHWTKRKKNSFPAPIVPLPSFTEKDH